MNRADFADPNDELTRLLRRGAEPVPFDVVDWASLSARIEQAINELNAAELDALRCEHESAVEDCTDEVSGNVDTSQGEPELRSFAGNDLGTPPRH